MHMQKTPESPFEKDSSSSGLIKGERIKFDGSNRWTDISGTPLNPANQYLVPEMRTGLQRWVKKDGKSLPEVIMEKPLPDIDELNAAIPVATWDKGLDGKPRKPWLPIWVVYLLNPATGKVFTHVNFTTGLRVAYNNLIDQVLTMRTLRGEDVVPIVKLVTKPMKTEFGVRPRPEFEVVEFRSMGGAIANKQAPQLEHKIGEPVEPVSTEEALNDSLPDHLK
jgi:hypothetical protein